MHAAELTIDRAEASDIPGMAALHNRIAADSVASFATEPEPPAVWLTSFAATAATHPWLIARAAGQLVGFAKAAPHKMRGAYAWTAELSVYVEPLAHGRGVGAALYAALLPTLRNQGYATLLAGIALPNAASVRLHESFGLTHAGTFQRAGFKFSAWRDVGYWQRHFHTGHAGLPPVAPVETHWLAMRLQGESPTGPLARNLLDQADAELSALYPEAGANHFSLAPAEVQPGRGAFLVGTAAAEAVACGAVRLLSAELAEIKRMFVVPAHRDKGLARRMLVALEAHARQLGAERLVLETGDRQPDALRLYERAGFGRTASFGDYRGSPHSLCMVKGLRGIV